MVLYQHVAALKVTNFVIMNNHVSGIAKNGRVRLPRNRFRQHSRHQVLAAEHRGLELRRLQNADRCRGGAEDVQAAVIGGDGLVTR